MWWYICVPSIFFLYVHLMLESTSLDKVLKKILTNYLYCLYSQLLHTAASWLFVLYLLCENAPLFLYLLKLNIRRTTGCLKWGLQSSAFVLFIALSGLLIDTMTSKDILSVKRIIFRFMFTWKIAIEGELRNDNSKKVLAYACLRVLN